MEVNQTSRAVQVLTILYFAISITELMMELFAYRPAIYFLKPLIPVVLMVLYYCTSESRNLLFFAALLLSAVTNVLFIETEPNMLHAAVITFTLHRICIVVFILKLIRLRDFIPLMIGVLPFLLIFFYLLMNSEVPENSMAVMVIQNILISIMGGVAVSNYIMADNRANSWLLISVLLFVALQVIVFIERYYLANLSPIVLRPIAMALNGFACYTFYEVVVASERQSDLNRTTV